jgi:hypothetical protein
MLIEQLLKTSHKDNLKATHLSGFVFGLSQGLIFFAYGAAFYAGSRFIANGDYDFLKMNTVLMAVIFSAM